MQAVTMGEVASQKAQELYKSNSYDYPGVTQIISAHIANRSEWRFYEQGFRE